MAGQNRKAPGREVYMARFWLTKRGWHGPDQYETFEEAWAGTREKLDHALGDFKTVSIMISKMRVAEDAV